MTREILGDAELEETAMFVEAVSELPDNTDDKALIEYAAEISREINNDYQ